MAVREQNEQFINRVARESRETLQRLVDQQMEPLLRQLNMMLIEFGRHQETYRAGVADLSQGVNSIKGSAEELAESARGYKGVADSISAHLKSVDTSQREFTSLVGTSASSMQGHGHRDEWRQGRSANRPAERRQGNGVQRRGGEPGTRDHRAEAGQNLYGARPLRDDPEPGHGRPGPDCSACSAAWSRLWRLFHR